MGRILNINKPRVKFLDRTKILNRFLKENGVTLKEYYEEVSNFRCNCGKQEAIEHVNGVVRDKERFLRVIDCTLAWRRTKRGFSFWQKMNNMFPMYVVQYEQFIKNE